MMHSVITIANSAICLWMQFILYVFGPRWNTVIYYIVPDMHSIFKSDSDAGLIRGRFVN